MNERTINRNVNITFEEIDHFSKSIITFKFLNKKNRVSHAKIGFLIVFNFVNKTDINVL